ncbi:MAG: ADP-ribosylglycohydrolase family protein [Nanoarchaeota archaeon]|nr:ADP-ribosylglycohydrolase family protein [Nanoarchaeota archaeon]
MTNKEKYEATLIGCAIGDVLGMPIEGWKREQIKKYVGKVREFIDPVLLYDEKGELLREDEFGRLKYYTKNLKKGEYTDDTILTIAIAESIAEKKYLDLDDNAKKQLDAFLSDKSPDGKFKSGFGKTTKDGFYNLSKGISPLESGVIGGPGAAPSMKISPVGLYMNAVKDYENGLLCQKCG